MAKIVIAGSLNMDLVAFTPRLPLPGETLTGARFLSEPGGKGANQAYAAARLGGEVAMLGRVGSDEFGKRMVANLAAAGCDVTGVQSVPGASGVAVIHVAQDGQNAIAVVPGANHAYLPAECGAERGWHGAQFALLQLEIPLSTVIAAAQAAKRHGAKVILDPAPAPEALPGELLECVDILTPNETEAQQLARVAPGHLGLEDAKAVASRLRATGVAAVIVKLGARGCLLSEARGASFVEAPAVDAVDSTAAGDVFNAALAVACSEGADLLTACQMAVRAAALSVTRHGAQPSMPTRAEVDAFAASSVRR